MMRERRLKSIQWLYVRQGFGLAVFTVAAVAAVLLLLADFFRRDPEAASWLSEWLGVVPPLTIRWGAVALFLLAALAVAAVIGVVGGYVVGNLMKKRLHTILEAAWNLERGLLSYRVPELGADELGEIGWLLNRLAAKWEEQVASLQRLANHNASLAEQARQGAVLQERQRLARELHDAVSQQLFAIAMTTAAIRRSLSEQPEQAARRIELVEEMAAAAQAEMRALLLHLRPATLQNRSLEEAIGDLLEELRQKHGIDVHWEIRVTEPLSSGIEDHLFRILQEAISNTLRHARARRLEVKLFTLKEQVRLRIADDGVGFDVEGEKMTSYGLKSIHERVHELGGSMDIYSSVGKGTQIEVRIPLLAEADEGGASDDPGAVGG